MEPNETVEYGTPAEVTETISPTPEPDQVYEPDIEHGVNPEGDETVIPSTDGDPIPVIPGGEQSSAPSETGAAPDAEYPDTQAYPPGQSPADDQVPKAESEPYSEPGVQGTTDAAPDTDPQETTSTTESAPISYFGEFFVAYVLPDSHQPALFAPAVVTHVNEDGTYDLTVFVRAGLRFQQSVANGIAPGQWRSLYDGSNNIQADQAKG